MNEISNEDLIQKAASVIKKRTIRGYTVGGVGCAPLASNGNVYTGVDIDTSSGMGFCAEHSAIAAMVTAGESKIKKIVATWKDENGNLFVLPPCGRCREFIKQIHEENLDSEVVIGKDNSVKLIELLPHCGEFNKT